MFTSSMMMRRRQISDVLSCFRRIEWWLLRLATKAGIVIDLVDLTDFMGIMFMSWLPECSLMLILVL